MMRVLSPFLVELISLYSLIFLLLAVVLDSFFFSLSLGRFHCSVRGEFGLITTRVLTLLMGSFLFISFSTVNYNANGNIQLKNYNRNTNKTHKNNSNDQILG